MQISPMEQSVVRTASSRKRPAHTSTRSCDGRGGYRPPIGRAGPSVCREEACGYRSDRYGHSSSRVRLGDSDGYRGDAHRHGDAHVHAANSAISSSAERADDDN